MVLEVKSSPGKGRGVFATAPIAEKIYFERSPVIVIPQDEKKHLKKTILSSYYFAWGYRGRERAIALGFGSLFNHSYTPNAHYDFNEEQKTIDFYALRPIAEGEEITINYRGTPDSRDPVWFSSID